MPHMPHRSLKSQPKPSVAEETPIQRVTSGLGIGDRHLGTTRIPRPRALKPPIG